MKKILPSIFIFLIIANILAPLTVGTRGGIVSAIPRAEAGGAFNIHISPGDGSSATISGTYEFSGIPNGTKSVLYGGTNKDSLVALSFKNQLPEVVAKVSDSSGVPIANRYSYSFKYIYTGLAPGTTYYIQVEVSSATTVIEKSTIQSFNAGGTGVVQDNTLTVSLADAQKKVDDLTKKCAAETDPTKKAACSEELRKASEDLKLAKQKYDEANPKKSSIDSLPACGLGITDNSSVMGCVVKITYYALFVPTSYLFALAGMFFDNTFAYSIQDTSYRTPFITSGWGLVRDFCNIFFIFVLLYVAFSTILNVHGFKTKEMIINVVIIGIMINFSLFAAQLIIDTSNIVARIFYDPDVVKITINGASSGDNLSSANPLMGGIALYDAKTAGNRLQLSAAIVGKVNPATLINGANKANVLQEGEQVELGAGTWFLVTLLAIGINIVGITVFLSVGLLFVSRVIGLWIYMIFAPLAFFSYTVPSMQGLGMVGWKKWWPELLSLSFLAPVFMFFIYLIIKFLGTDLGIFQAGNKPFGIAFLVGIVVPFAFIMILMTKAKDIAKKMSGELGQSITGGVAAVGGLALGGAALGAAFLGRQTMGAVAKYAQNDGAREKALKFNDTKEAMGKIKGWNAFNPLAYAKVATTAIGGVGKAATAGIGAGISQIGKKTDPHTGKTTSAFQREGKKITDKTHSEHVLDEKAQAVTGQKDAKYKDLTEDDQKTVKERIDRDIISKEKYNKVYEKLDATQRTDVDNQKGVIDPTTGTFAADPNGSFSHKATEAQTAAATRGEHIHTGTDLEKATKVDTVMSEFVNAMRKGSYDIRNLSQTQSKSKGFLPQFGLASAALIANGMRSTLKQANINYGEGKKDFFKDLGNTITEAVKSASVKVDLASHAGVASHDDDHGGGGGHH